MERQGALNVKLRQDLGRALSTQAVNMERIRTLEVEKIALEMDKEVLEKEKEELRQQVLMAGGQTSEGAGMAQWKERAEFWSTVGAKIMVRKALCSPELKEWLLALTSKCTDIGYTEGVTAVYTANRQREKAASFPYYKEGDTDGPEYIDGQIAELQNGIVDFEFLRYIEANPGLSSQDLAAVFEQVYPEGGPEVNVSAGGVSAEAAENVRPMGGSGGANTSGQIDLEVPEIEEVMGEIAGVTEELVEEDLGNAKEE